jgi:transketolase C-terminal domain/subunit
VGAVAEALVTVQVCVSVGFIGLVNCHAECGSYAELLKKYRLNASTIAAKVRETVAKSAKKC